MFTGELAESRQTEVVIRDIDERAMELLIDFAYTSQVTTGARNTFSLIIGFRYWWLLLRLHNHIQEWHDNYIIDVMYIFYLFTL